MNKIRLLIADDHSLVRLGFASLLSYQPDLEVVGTASDGEEAVRLFVEQSPDVVVMDLRMPRVDGVEATRRIRTLNDAAKILILTTFGTSVDVARAITAGASGAIMKDSTNDELLDAIRTVMSGGTVFSPEVKTAMNEEANPPEFTKKQMEVLYSLTRGLTNADIAKLYGITTDAAKRHVMVIFKKLGASNRAEAVMIALRRQLLKI
jgi:two-component system NarL family response regulator